MKKKHTLTRKQLQRRLSSLRKDKIPAWILMDAITLKPMVNGVIDKVCVYLDFDTAKRWKGKQELVCSCTIIVGPKK